MNRPDLVDIFPIDTPAFAFSADWFHRYVPTLIGPAYSLLTLLLIVSIGVAALKRFEDIELERKVWNIPVVIVLIAAWPGVVIGLKNLVDTFNTFLARSVFGIEWAGFGFQAPRSWREVIGWPVEGIIRIWPLLAYWIIYAFYLVFFFFFAVLGPLILAKGVLHDEIETFIELVREITLLFLWQTMVIVLVGFILPDIASNKPFPVPPPSTYLFLSFLLGVLILFVPSMTRKFGSQIGGAFFPPGSRLGGTFLTTALIGKVGHAVTGGTLSAPMAKVRHFALRAEEIFSRVHDHRHVAHLQAEKRELEHEFRHKLDAAEEELEHVEKEAHQSVALHWRAKKEFET